MRLRVEGDSSRPQEFVLSESEVAIVGRDASRGATICVPDVRVAKRHFALGCEGGAWWIEDCESHCGIYVNGTSRAQGRHAVTPSDTIQIGDLVFRLVP
jgi:pSer/pThr/pTyr-binding forkhead associated (FHA) protein